MLDSGNQSGLLLFAVGPVYCVAEAVRVAAVIRPAPLTHLPGDHESAGFFRHGGGMVRLVDLRRRFGLDAQDSVHRRIIIVDKPDGAVGYLVDRVDNVIGRAEGRFGPTPRYVPREAFPGTFTRNDRLHLYVDLDRLLTLQSSHWLRESGLFPEVEEAEGARDSGAAGAADQPAEPGTTEPPEAPASRTVSPEMAFDARATRKNSVPADAPPPFDRASSHKAGTNPREQRSIDPAASQSQSAQSPHVLQSVPPRPASVMANTTPRTPTGEPLGGRASAKSAKAPAAVTGPRAARAVNSGQSATRNHLSARAPATAGPVYEDSGSSGVGWGLAGLLVALLAIGIWLLLGDEIGMPVSAPEQVESMPSPAAAPPSFGSAITEEPLEPVLPVDQPTVAAPPETPVVILDGGEDASPLDVDHATMIVDETPSPLTRDGSLVTLVLEEPVEGMGERAPANAEALPSTTLEPVEPESEVEAPAAPAMHEGRAVKREITHVVVAGDTLWAIARRYLDDPYRYPELARLSGIRDPDLIYPGDRVRILILSRQAPAR